MKIACVGCSWTEGICFDGYPLEKEQTYAYALSKWLENKKIKNTVYNAGRAGSSVDFYPIVIDYLLKEFNPDVFIIQMTTFDRNIMILDPLLEEDKKINFGYDQLSPQYYKIWDNNTNLIHLGPGMGWLAADSTSRKRIQVNDLKYSAKLKDLNTDMFKRIWEDRIKGKVAPNITLSEFSDFVSIWWEQYGHDTNYRPYQYYNQIYSLEDQLKALGKKVIPFYWLNFKPVNHNKLLPVRQYTVVENLFDEITFKKLQIDDGWHFGKEGNTRLVQEFLGPQVLETMK